MSYELFQQGPAAYIPVILVSLVVTVVAYGAFPFIFARARKKVITKKKYNRLCYGFNILVMIMFIALNGEPSSGGPYLLWTWVFSASGVKTLKNRGVLEGFQHFDYTQTSTYQASQVMGSDIALETEEKAETSPVQEEKPPICFCRKCGFELIEGSEFCSSCGTAVIKE